MPINVQHGINPGAALTSAVAGGMAKTQAAKSSRMVQASRLAVSEREQAKNRQAAARNAAKNRKFQIERDEINRDTQDKRIAEGREYQTEQTELARENKREDFEYEYSEKQRRELEKFNETEEYIKNDDTMDPDEKEDAIRQNNDKRNGVQRQKIQKVTPEDRYKKNTFQDKEGNTVYVGPDGEPKIISKSTRSEDHKDAMAHATNELGEFSQDKYNEYMRGLRGEQTKTPDPWPLDDHGPGTGQPDPGTGQPTGQPAPEQIPTAGPQPLEISGFPIDIWRRMTDQEQSLANAQFQGQKPVGDIVAQFRDRGVASPAAGTPQPVEDTPEGEEMSKDERNAAITKVINARKEEADYKDMDEEHQQSAILDAMRSVTKKGKATPEENAAIEQAEQGKVRPVARTRQEATQNYRTEIEAKVKEFKTDSATAVKVKGLQDEVENGPNEMARLLAYRKLENFKKTGVLEGAAPVAEDKDFGIFAAGRDKIEDLGGLIKEGTKDLWSKAKFEAQALKALNQEATKRHAWRLHNVKVPKGERVTFDVFSEQYDKEAKTYVGGKVKDFEKKLKASDKRKPVPENKTAAKKEKGKKGKVSVGEPIANLERLTEQLKKDLKAMSAWADAEKAKRVLAHGSRKASEKSKSIGRIDAQKLTRAFSRYERKQAERLDEVGGVAQTRYERSIGAKYKKELKAMSAWADAEEGSEEQKRLWQIVIKKNKEKAKRVLAHGSRKASKKEE